MTAKGRQTKTHCKHGHLFSKANTYIRTIGKYKVKVCRRCRAASQRVRDKRNRVMVKCTCELPRRICACAEARAYDKANLICLKPDGCNTRQGCADMGRCLSKEAFKNA